MISLLLLAGAAAAAPNAPERTASAIATALVRIERTQAVSSDQWRQAPRSTRRELVRKDELGRTIVIRVVEYQ